MFIDTGPTESPPAEFVKPAGTTASPMRPDVLSGRSVFYLKLPVTVSLNLIVN